MSKIGFLGPQGSFSDEALQLFLKTASESVLPSPLELIPYASIPKLLNARHCRELDFAFVPLENSTEGQVGAALDTLILSDDSLILREYVHPVNQNLLTVTPLELVQIQRVYSHEQALGQCRDFLETFLPQAEQIPCLSTAEAARKVAGSFEKWAAIANLRAAELYGLHCQVPKIQDAQLNATRFVLVGNGFAETNGDDKTSLLLLAENSPGSLYRILREFAERQINLTKIESRPSKKKLGEYVFFIDIDGHITTPAVQEVLSALKAKGIGFKVLGSYPKAPSGTTSL